MPTDLSGPVVYLALPTYDGRVEADTAHAAYYTATRGLCRIGHAQGKSSLLACGFNSLWCEAVNRAHRGELNRFAMLHADIVPEPYWLDTLERCLQEYDLDVVSCVVPIKDTRGITSTGIGDPLDEWAPPARTTIRDLDKLPAVFDATHYGRPEAPLYINTGCWLARLDRGGWQGRVAFTIRDRIVVKDQALKPEVIPEDWGFSRQLWQMGVPYAATSRVKLLHLGGIGFAQQGQPWGAWEHDELNDPQGQTRPV